MPAAKRPALLGGSEFMQGIQLAQVKHFTQHARPWPGQVRGGELAVAGQFSGELP